MLEEQPDNQILPASNANQQHVPGQVAAYSLMRMYTIAASSNSLEVDAAPHTLGSHDLCEVRQSDRVPVIRRPCLLL